MDKANIYDCVIIGGGLAGLALSVQLAKKGFHVILFEKEQYPFHKVCGEYLSLESVSFLEELDLPLQKWHLPLMKRLIITGPSGEKITSSLPLGGLGVSRYRLDGALAEVAKRSGVEVVEQTKVSDVRFQSSLFFIQTNNGTFKASVCCGAYGRRSNLDVKWKRKFAQQKAGKLHNFIGVKYHALLDHTKDVIALHNFENGYCGISAIEENKYCICYLTKAGNLRNNHNDIQHMEENVLYRNPHLKEIFTSAEFLFREPLTISQISFDKKKQMENHVLMVGDAAGMIAPLCGNGMSMALHGSRIAARLITAFLLGNMDRSALEQQYQDQWKDSFGKRLRTGRIIQKLFGNPRLTNIFIQALRPFPGAVRQIIKQTHGQTF